MSLSVDGVWKSGVWATTLWANGVWREGEPPALPTNPRNRLMVKRQNTVLMVKRSNNTLRVKG